MAHPVNVLMVAPANYQFRDFFPQLAGFLSPDFVFVGPF